MQILSWNVLASAMFSVLKEKHDCFSDPTYDRLALLQTKLEKLLELYPDAIFSIQEYGKTEQLVCLPVHERHGFTAVLGSPSSFAEPCDFTFWFKGRDDMTTALFFKEKNLLNSAVMDLTTFIPPQPKDVVFEPFTDVKGNPNGLNLVEEMQRRVSLMAHAIFKQDGKTISVVGVHLPCVWYKESFQALVIESLKHTASFLLGSGSDAVVFVGDFNIAKFKPSTGEKNPLWDDIVQHRVSDLLPPNFQSSGDKIKLCGYYDPDDSFISNWNGDFKSMIEGCIVYKKANDDITCVVTGKSADNSSTGMTESGPSYKYPSDHIPMVFELEFK